MVVKKSIPILHLIIPIHQASWSAIRPAVSQNVTDTQNIKLYTLHLWKYASCSNAVISAPEGNSHHLSTVQEVKHCDRYTDDYTAN